MRQFYHFEEKYHAVRDTLTWTHYREVMKLKNINEIKYYIDISIQYNLSYRDLRKRIKSKEYQRLSEDTKEKLIKKQEIEVTDYINNPIVIKNSLNYEHISEKALQNLILEDIPSFLEELGEGFSFIRNEYKIKLGSSYNYIDLLLYNYIYRCFVVIELKVTELKKEHIGQLKLYMNYIDKNIKDITDNKTIGLIISRKNNRFVIEYSTDSRISFREYVII